MANKKRWARKLKNQLPKKGRQINCFFTKIEEYLDKDLETTINNGGLKIMRKYFI